MSTFPAKFNHRWKCTEQKKKFQTIVVIISRKLTMFQYRSESPQVKRNLISTISNLVYELPHELPNDLRPRNLGN